MSKQKKKKRMEKRICRLETQIACLELELEQLCQALAYFLTATANVSMPNVSAAVLEKEFKALYKKYKKAQKHASKNFNVFPLLPGDTD